MSRLRTLAAVGAIAAISGAGGAWAGVATSAPSLGTANSNGSPTATSLAPIVRTTLASQTTVPGTIGYDGAFAVVLPAGTTASGLAQARQKVTADNLAVGAARTGQRDTAAAADQSVGQARSALGAAQSAVAGDQAQLHRDQAAGQPAAALAADDQALARDQASLGQATGALSSAQQHATQTEHQADAQLATANATLSADQAALAEGERTALNPGATFTDLPTPGQVVSQGQPLYALDSRPVPLLYGATTAWRALSAGMDDGPDVAELNTDLVALGMEPAPLSGAHFSAATAAGISRLQASVGRPSTGALNLGDVVFAPGPVEISSVAVLTGSPAQPGSTVLAATSTALVVTAQIPLASVGSVKPGEAVTVDLPNGRNGVPGRVRAVGTSVTSPSAGGNQSQAGTGGNGQGGTSATTVNATVTFADPSVAVGLDQAAVLLHVATATVRDVLAVPVDALLVLGEGGEGVEVVSGGVHRVVAVRVGLFTGTQVEIDGSGLAPGMDVVVPTS
jgi:multidrug efflux pump subunit AcrA (membrane-fusion protein)